MFRRWCSEQNFFNDNNLSHVLMDGGVLSVPFDSLNEFYNKYIEAVNSGEKIFVVEQKTENYNFFVDIDYKGEESLNLDEIKDICKIICDKVKRHGGKDCLISVSPPKNVGSLIKTGVHLNWPGLVVNQASAIALREHILVALYNAKKSKDWNEIIDSAVYGDMTRRSRGSGFRMPWSHKKGKHEACGGKGCETCKQTGKTTQLAYLPVFVYKSGPLSGLLQIEQHPDIEVLKMSAVRTESTDIRHVESPTRSVKEGSFSDIQTKDELKDEEIRSLVEQFIQENMEGQSDSRVTKIFKHNAQYLVSTNSRYCENLKRPHGSNHVWFYINGHNIAQKCFCRCETLDGRRDGFCKDFRGRVHTLPGRIIDKVYPNRSEIKKTKEIKKPVDQPVIDAKQDIEDYIQKFLKGHENTKIIRVTKEKQSFMVTTSSNYCEHIRDQHEKCTIFKIKKHTITQECRTCKKIGRSYQLNKKITDKLYPSKN